MNIFKCGKGKKKEKTELVAFCACLAFTGSSYEYVIDKKKKKSGLAGGTHHLPHAIFL